MMRKRFISVCIVAILAFSIFDCVQTAEDTPAAETETVGTENTEIESEEADAVDDEAGSEGQAGPIYIIEPELTQGDTYEMQDWQAAYVEYIERLEGNRNDTYSLIYVDDDDIPELVIDTGHEAGGCEILTFHDGEIDVLQTMRLHFYYIEKKNLVNNFGGKMGYYFDHIYSIENGKWVYVAGGEWTETYVVEDDDLVYQYKWDSEEVKEDVYKQRLNAVFDMEQKIEPDLYYIMDEMLALFKTGNVASQNHRYELFVENVTWDEARRRCEERGGYLATITSPEEYERIQKGVLDSCQTDTAFWVGACDNKDVLGQYIFGFGWLEPNKEPDDYCMLNHFKALFIFWEPSEPSYEVEVEGKTIKEDFVYLMYDDTEERCYLYDAPMDMLSVWPEYTGKIGYICEYDSVTVMAKETVHTANGNIDYWHEYEYDSAGNRIKDTVYRIGDGSFWYGYEYEYDSAGYRTKEIHYTIDGRVDWRYKYEYDSVGNLTKEIRYNVGSIECWNEYEYDSIGNLTKEIYYNADGSIGRWYEYEHDSAGNETKTTGCFGDGRFWYGCESEYDDVGNKTKNILYNADGSISGCEEWKWEYGYDSAGNRIKEIQRDSGGKIIGEYEYDSTENLIKEIEYKYNNDFNIEEWEYDNMGNLTMSKHMEYVDGEITDYSWHEYEYITIIPRKEVTVSADESCKNSYDFSS